MLPLVVAGAGAALVPESTAVVAERLGAVVAQPTRRPSGSWPWSTGAGALCPLPPLGSLSWPCSNRTLHLSDHVGEAGALRQWSNPNVACCGVSITGAIDSNEFRDVIPGTRVALVVQA